MFNNKSIKILNCQQQFNKSFKLKHFMLSSGRWGLWVAEGRRKCSQQDPALCFQEELRAISRGDSRRIQDRPCVEGPWFIKRYIYRMNAMSQFASYHQIVPRYIPCHVSHHKLVTFCNVYLACSFSDGWVSCPCSQDRAKASMIINSIVPRDATYAMTINVANKKDSWHVEFDETLHSLHDITPFHVSSVLVHDMSHIHDHSTLHIAR